MVLMFICSWASCVCTVQNNETKPPELLQSENVRARIATARIEWCGYGGKGGADSPERFFTSRIAGPDDLFVRRGFADGRMHEQAEVGRPLSFNESRLLLKAGEQWSYSEDTLTAKLVQEPSQYSLYHNLRDLGFEPSPVSSSDIGYWFRTAASGYDVDRADDRVVVTGHWSNGYSVRWTLDPAQGMQPVTAEVVIEGNAVDACQTTYEQYDGIWFPRKSEFTHNGEVTSTIHVLDAEFNRPELPTELTPTDLGLIDGIRVRHPMLGDMVWCDGQLIPEDDYFSRVKAGTADNSAWEAMRLRNQSLGPGAFPKPNSDDFLGMTAVVTHTPGLWEDYTRRFIRRFQLNVRQTELAWKVLKDAQRLAYSYFDEQEKVFRKTRADLAVIAPKTSDADQSKHMEELQDRLQRLYAPIDKIFSEKLKPGLAKLVTPDQVEAVRKRDAQFDKAVESANTVKGKRP